MLWILLGAAVLLILMGIRIIPETERGVVDRFGQKRVVGPGVVLVIPVIERVDRISVEAFSVSLPPQSAITKDEIPIQLQASLDARVRDPKAAAGVRDWRVFLMSELQMMMKDRIEDLDFDGIDRVFPGWVGSIRKSLDEKAAVIGVELTSLQISNLSPRARPVTDV